MLVKQKEEQIKSGEESWRQINVLMGFQVEIVAAVLGVSCGEDGCPSVETSGDTGFSDGDCLLFHDFVDVGTVTFVHFIEFINSADTGVRKHESATFENEFSSHVVFAD